MGFHGFRLCTGLGIGVFVFAACAVSPAQEVRRHDNPCHTPAGELPDTLYLGERLADVVPPTPRPPHLAPYPPAAEGEFRLRFDGAWYYPSGAAARVSVRETSFRIVRTGFSDQIPVYRRDDPTSPPRRTFWAPITDTCVFLPFTLESEMRD